MVVRSGQIFSLSLHFDWLDGSPVLIDSDRQYFVVELELQRRLSLTFA